LEKHGLNKIRSGNLLERLIVGRLQGKSTSGRKRIGLLSDLIGKKIMHASKEEHKIGISG